MIKQKLALLFVWFCSSYFVRAQSAELPAFTIVPGQVFQASVVLDEEGHSTLRMDLISVKRTDFADFTKRNLNKQIQVVVDGKSMIQPVIKSAILGGSLEIPCSSPESALALAKTLMAK